MHRRLVATISTHLVACWLAGLAAAAHAQTIEPQPELPTPIPIPTPVTAKEGFVAVTGARLWYWDTGGDGPAVVLLHPATGSGLVWGYQQPVFAKAGYRVIGYSRKQHAKSEIAGDVELQSDVDDLHALVHVLKLKKFHAVGSAAGGGIAMQYAVKHPEMLQSITLACSLGSVRDEKYHTLLAAVRPANFSALSVELRELGPAYRAADIEGTRRWIELAKLAHTREARPSPADSTIVTWEKLAATKIPTLFLGGDADLYLPPPLLKYCHQHLAGSEMQIIDGCGHSAYWEQPGAFNRAVLDFLSRTRP
jgi:pimeloyl-ACP methyl ester carboxylesterase